MAIENSSIILDHDVRKRALERIGCFIHTQKYGRQLDYRKRLSWFVGLSQTKLETASLEELRSLREDVRALLEEGSEGVTSTQSDADTATQLPRIHATVAKYLGQLTQTGSVRFEPFKLEVGIDVPRFHPALTTAHVRLKHPFYVSEYVDPLDGEGVLYQFFLALKGAAGRLRKCLHCTVLFVQTRRKQEYCSTRCRVRALRARQLKEREKRRTRRILRNQKGAKHGTKRR